MPSNYWQTGLLVDNLDGLAVCHAYNVQTLLCIVYATAIQCIASYLCVVGSINGLNSVGISNCDSSLSSIDNLFTVLYYSIVATEND